MDCNTPGFPVVHHLLEFAQTHAHLFSDAIQPFHLLSSPSPLAFIFPSIRAFSSESVLCIRWPKYWSFSFRISPSNEYSGLISFRMDWLDLLAVRETLKTLLQHHSSKDQFFSGSKTNIHAHVENEIRLEGTGSSCLLIPNMDLALFLAHIHVLLSQLLSWRKQGVLGCKAIIVLWKPQRFDPLPYSPSEAGGNGKGN